MSLPWLLINVPEFAAIGRRFEQYSMRSQGEALEAHPGTRMQFPTFVVG
jgi:hypothetical protein